MYPGTADALELWPACWEALLRTASVQQEHQLAEDPARRFIAIVGALLSSKQAHLGRGRRWPARRSGGSRMDARSRRRVAYCPHCPQIGWIRDDDLVCLIPEAAFAQAQRLASGQGAPIPIGAKTLWKRLAEARLSVRAKGRNTLKVAIGARRVRCIAFPLAILYVAKMGTMGIPMDRGAKKPGAQSVMSPFFVPISGSAPQNRDKKWGQTPGRPRVGPHCPHCPHFWDLLRERLCCAPTSERSKPRESKHVEAVTSSRTLSGPPTP